MSAPNAADATYTVDLKNRWLAALLALLVPGLGHFYQGRVFKAVIYGVCILGLFFSGQALGDWKVVYLGDSDTGGRMAVGGRARIIGRLLQGYGAQFPVGVFAWPAVVQSRRYSDPANDVGPRIAGPMSTEFAGGLWYESEQGPQALVRVRGTVTLEPDGANARGKFVGETEDGRPVEIELTRLRDLGRKVSAQEERTLDAEIAALPAGVEAPPGVEPRLVGGIPRPLTDRYQVPLGDRGEDELTAKLGGRLEIAYVFTWIAGLLNVLAIWDALDGPAYGIGNEPESKKKRRRWGRKDESEPAKPEAGRRLEPAGRGV